MNPDPVTAVERAFALLELKRPRQALEHLGHAVAADPEIPQLHCLIALARLQLEDAKGALSAAQAAVAADPEEEWAHRLRAIALIGVGRKGEARDAALEAAALAPEEATTHIVLANALQATGDEAGAVAAARHAVGLDPDDPDTHSTLGEVLFEQERLHEAVVAYEDALRLNPEDADTLNNLAVARLRSHDRSGTGRQFEAAAMLDPRHEIARHNILHTGGAGRTFAYRRFALAFVALAVLSAPFELGTAIAMLMLALPFEVVRLFETARLNPPTRRLLADDRRARRFKLKRWDWAWPTRLRPWWWVLLTRLLPPPVLLAVNVFVFAASVAGLLVLWALVSGIALPFSIMRAWRWHRRRHPRASSWRPPA